MRNPPSAMSLHRLAFVGRRACVREPGLAGLLGRATLEQIRLSLFGCCDVASVATKQGVRPLRCGTPPSEARTRCAARHPGSTSRQSRLANSQQARWFCLLLRFCLQVPQSCRRTVGAPHCSPRPLRRLIDLHLCALPSSSLPIKLPPVSRRAKKSLHLVVLDTGCGAVTKGFCRG